MNEYSTDRDSLISPGDLDTLARYARGAPPGAFVEVGVYRGGSARVLYQIAEEQGRRLWLYDTFEGHPTPTEDDDAAHPQGRYADCADPDALQAEMPHARILMGRLIDTFDTFVGPVAFAHIDVDLYESTRHAIWAFRELAVPGGILYFDDYGLVSGATKAIDELLPDREVLPNGKAIWRR